MKLALRELAARNENVLDILMQQSAIAMGRDRPSPPPLPSANAAAMPLVADYSVKQLTLSILFIENLIEYTSTVHSNCYSRDVHSCKCIQLVHSFIVLFVLYL